LGLYAILAKAGYFSTEWLNGFCQYDSPLGGHPDSLKVPGIEASTGSLGHGLPFGVGMCLGNRSLLQKSERPRIVVLIGDGESNEGTIWEAAQLAGHHKLSELVCIVDHNHSTDRALTVDPLRLRFEAFGWDTINLSDGHNVNDLSRALLETSSSRPRAIIAETTKGKGILTMENNPAWHHALPSFSELDELLLSIL